ncbi:putative transposase, partial [Neisseria meningitidis NM43]
MSTFFQQTAQAMIAKHIDRFPLLKLDQVIDWQPIEQRYDLYAEKARQCGKPATSEDSVGRHYAQSLPQPPLRKANQTQPIFI